MDDTIQIDSGIMEKVYTTAELIQILNSERQACLNGQRLNLNVAVSGFNPAIDKIIKPEPIQKFTAYRDFQMAVHRYQIEHQVSGIVWHHLKIADRTLEYPFVDERLIAIPSDLVMLQNCQHSVLNFWHEVTQGMDLYLILKNGKDYRKVEPTEVEAIADRTQWASVWKWEKSDFLEIILQLGWGQPAQASYRRGWPDAGSEYIHAVKPDRRPTC